MKPEPLKNKIGMSNACIFNSEIALTSDIKSAIEWLKRELTSFPICKSLNYVVLIETIDEAFEDVMGVEE